jgi:pilus assembly protein FimV
MKFRILLVLLALVAPTVVNALGLGKLELQSALNQPFKARVELLSATANELDSLKISLADEEAFQRAGIQRTFLLTKLRFRVEETESGSDYIRISSSESIREPFLNFLLEINWSKGRLYREYTVLLDPPTYTVPSSRKRAVIHPEAPVVGIDADDHQVVYDLDYEPGKTRISQPAPVTSTPSYEPTTSYAEPAAIDYAGSGDYGPAVAGDTLWSIAAAARPDSSVSIQQMMLAILNANPDAFIENNINGLKRGAILQIPDATEIDSMDRKDVLAQVNSQHALWDEYRGHIASTVSQQAESSGAYSPDEVEVAEEPEVVEDGGEAELRLISETEQDAGGDQSTASTGVDVDALNNELALANESIEALFLENAELKDKLTETEGIIDDLKRLIVLKEDELASMQEQIMIAAAEQESAEAIADETMAEEEVEEEFVEEEEVAEEEMEAEASEDEVVEEVVFADDQGAGALSGLIDMGMGMVEKAKANLMIIGGVIGGLLLLAFLMIFVSKRRSAKATVIEVPEEDFPDFADEVDSESVTMIQESEDETAAPGDDSPDKVSADKVSADKGLGDEEKIVFLGADSKDAEPDAFDVPADTVKIHKESAPEIPEEDPMEEVNVFLAYEHFDEAETFVRKALEDEPDNLSFHSKLLEVFYAAGNKKPYEDAAKVIHEKTGGEGEYWDMATVMWQEMSPNRALFETPATGEEEAEVEELDTTGTGGNVLNIADDGSDADIDLDITGSFPGKESDENMLDITATADLSTEVTQSSENLDMDDTLSIPAAERDVLLVLDNTVEKGASDEQNLQQAQEDVADEILDITAAIDIDEATAQSSVEESEGLDLSLDEVSIDLDAGETSISTEQQTDDSNELDISFGDTSVGGEDILDVSIAQVSEDSNELDISFEDTSVGGEEDILDVSIAQVSEEASEESNELDISFEDTSVGGEEDILDVSITQVSEEASEDSNELDISFGDTSVGGEEDILDVSIAQVSEEASEDSNELDMSLGESSGGVSIELDMSLDDSSAADEDLLDVTSTINFESEGEGDLLDLSTPASEDVDAGVDIDTGTSGEIDLYLGTESPEISLEDDLLGGTGDEADALMALGDHTGDLDFDIGTVDANESADLDMDIDSTVEMSPGSREPLTMTEDVDPVLEDMESTIQMAPARARELSMVDDDDEDDDDDKTFIVPRSTDVDTQSEDEEMASQLDLAKAYIELGDNENAKTILDEIIAQGNENYRKQAEELSGQIK